MSPQPEQSSSLDREAGESPPPERQEGKQLHETPASGRHETSDPASSEHKMQGNADQELGGLKSNPKGPMDDDVERKFAKTAKPEPEAGAEAASKQE